jgi:TonB family protein
MRVFSSKQSLVMALACAALQLTKLSAQSLLYAENDGKMMLVHAAKKDRALVKVDGKLIPASGTKLGLRNCDEFLPVFIDVRSQTSTLRTTQLDHFSVYAFDYAADFESQYFLDNVFLVLEMHFADKSSGFYVHEIGSLIPNQRCHLSVTVPLESNLGNHGHFFLHLFVGGQEVFQSTQSVGTREAAVDLMIARRTPTQGNSSAERLLGPDPIYPEAMFKAGIGGNATVRFRIGIDGAVIDPQIGSESDSEFGQAALYAIKQWRFIPRVVNGKRVEVTTAIPFSFAVPKN